MANNIDTADFTGAKVTIATTEAGGVHTPHHRDPETIAAVLAVVAKLTADPATQATLAAVLAKLTADPATNTGLAAIASLLTTQAGFLDGIETLQGSGNASLASIVGFVDNIETILQAATPAGELHIGSFGGNTSYVDVTLTTDTAIYATGEVLADTQPIANAMRINNGTGVLQSVQLLDEDDQGVALDLIFLSANNTLGAENATVTITDALARDILGSVSFATGDYMDLGGCRIATRTGIGLVVKPETGTRIVYVAAITRGAPTYSATGLKLRLGFLQD